MNIKTIFQQIYFDNSRLTMKDAYKSRQLFVFEGMTARAIFALTSGAFLAGYAKYLGAGDSFNGIIAAIPALACLLQFFSPMIFEKISRRKLLISVLCLFHRVSLGSMVFIPLIFSDSKWRVAALALLYFISYSSAQFITPAASNWIVSLTPDNVRGRYFGVRDSYILGCQTVITIILGRILDHFKDNGFEYGGFTVLFIIVLLFACINFILLSSIKEPEVPKSDVQLDIRNIIRTPLEDQNFKKIILLFLVWNIGLHVGLPFFAVYLVTGLNLSYTYITLMGIIGSVTNVVVVRFWGKMADRKSWMFTTQYSIGFLGITHILWMLINAKTAFVLVPLVHVLGGAAWAGINISLFNVQFFYAPENGRTVYLGFNAALGGVVGFLIALVSSTIVGTMGGYNFGPASFSIGAMQLVFGLSGVIMLFCVVYARSRFKEASE